MAVLYSFSSTVSSPSNQWSPSPPIKYPSSQPYPWSQNWRGNAQSPSPFSLSMQLQLQFSPLKTLVPTPPLRPQLPVQPNPNPNNKASQSIEAQTTFQTYLITPIGLNEI